MQTRTTFILGAGASKPYGFPTGLELIDILALESRADVKHVADASYIGALDKYAVWQPLPQNPGQNYAPSRREILNDFRVRVRNAKGMSIDAFLAESRRKGDEHMYELGKQAIACVILKSESSIDRLMSVRRNDDWYRLLLHAVIRDVDGHIDLDRLWSAPISFVTFNYDRSLEYFFFTVASTRGLAPEEAMRYVKRLQIYHVYGQAGQPTARTADNDPSDKDGVKYGEESRLGIAAEGIRIIGESERDQLPRGLMDAINQANRVIISGFGFDPYNTELLDMRRWMADPRKRVVITEMGLSYDARRLLKEIEELRDRAIVADPMTVYTQIERLKKTRTMDMLWDYDVLSS